MAQSLIIGLGGTGSRIVNQVVKELRKNGKTINDGQICCAVLDTNVNDNEKIMRTGTAIPVIATSRPARICDYLDDYAHLHFEEWCPQSPAFLQASMIDGASEMRVKSRLAFEDCIESGSINDLEMMINGVLQSSDNSKIRIMIVSSLSGGTGSGMFIQVALWLRKIFARSQITIRGIFLLPDVFVQTLKDIKQNKETSSRHYTNAYAAIRELNALTKIRIGGTVDLTEDIKIGRLFNSAEDKDCGVPVFDYAFFIDDKDSNGVRLASITDYEKLAAQLVYMQLFAPMKDDMYSEEDNTFLAFSKSPEPLYGCCGSAKAVYPTDSIKEYCAMRAAQEALSSGWKKIDSEIEAKKEEKKESDLYSSEEKIDEQAEYIKLYEDEVKMKSSDRKEKIKDPFFRSIAKDPFNEKLIKNEDKISVQYTDKVDDFLKAVKTDKIDRIITRNHGFDEYILDVDQFVEDDHSLEDLKDKIVSDKQGMGDALASFEEKADEFAETIVNEIFPLSMGKVTPESRASIYGFLSKKDDMGKWNFVHPVSARYLVYKLVRKLEKDKGSIVLSSSREDAVTGGDIGALFDNPRTSKVETSPEEFLGSKSALQRMGKFLDEFEGRYAQYVNSKIMLCQKYEKELLIVKVYNELIVRLKLLIEQIEAFFRKLNDVYEQLQKSIRDNASSTVGTVGKIQYVYGSKENKEKIFRSLNFDLDKSNANVSRSVMDATYGRVCAERRPSNPDNAEYLDVSVISAFVKEIIRDYMEKINGKKENKEIVEIDIYTAVCKEADDAASKIVEDNEIGRINFATGETREDNSKEIRHARAFKTLTGKLQIMAAPFLMHSKERSKDELGTTTMRTKTFWGFGPAVVKAYPEIGAVLGVNADLKTDSAYPKDELSCYNADYGISAIHISKFNELAGGEYYTCYKHTIDKMMERFSGTWGERALVETPHLDKRWHTLLPYVTTMMEAGDTNSFYHGFWLALAYGVLKIDKEGKFYLRRSIDSGYGTSTIEKVTIVFKDKAVGKTDIPKLIDALRTDKTFTSKDIPALEEKFQRELEEMDTYVGTKVIKGLTTKTEDLNPICIVTRYHSAPKHDKQITSRLIGALGMIALELAQHYKVARSAERTQLAADRICKRIYDSSERIKGRSEVFETWEEKFEKIKGRSAEEDEDEGVTPVGGGRVEDDNED